MCLTLIEQQVLHDASLRWFGMSPQEAAQCETHMAAEPYRALGERKIDIVVNTGRLDLPIYRFTGLPASSESGYEFAPGSAAQVAACPLTAGLHPIEEQTNA